jgi:hypothetical protein
MNNLTIDTFTIKQDADGRYSLNDLHKAAGGENKHRPVYYFSLDSTKELIQEITSQGRDSDFDPIKVSRGGRTPGTYVCPEVVVAYGMWISPQFALKVIRMFLKLEKHGVVIHEKAVEGFLADPKKYEEELTAGALTTERCKESPTPKWICYPIPYISLCI